MLTAFFFLICAATCRDVEPVCIVQDFATHGTLAEYIHAPLVSSAAAALGASLAPASDMERAVGLPANFGHACGVDCLIGD